ncbi:MAG: hypothetical protein ACRDYE_02275 [Acidimicrobiales bacterium]
MITVADRPRSGIPALTVVLGLLSAPLATPVLPEGTAVAAHLDTGNQDLGGMLGWPRVVGQIAAAAQTLPSGVRRHVVAFTANYSESGAVDFYGPALGLRRRSVGTTPSGCGDTAARPREPPSSPSGYRHHSCTATGPR